MRRGASGFSLVELMVVMVLIGLVSVAVVLTWPADDDPLVSDAERFAGAVERAAQESILSGKMLGVRLGPDGYGFVRFDQGLWIDLPANRSFGPRAWDEAVRMQIIESAIQAGGRRPARAAPQRTGGVGERVQDPRLVPPDIWFDPVGMATPFLVVLERDGREVTVSGDAAGDVAINEAP